MFWLAIKVLLWRCRKNIVTSQFAKVGSESHFRLATFLMFLFTFQITFFLPDSLLWSICAIYLEDKAGWNVNLLSRLMFGRALPSRRCTLHWMKAEKHCLKAFKQIAYLYTVWGNVSNFGPQRWGSRRKYLSAVKEKTKLLWDISSFPPMCFLRKNGQWFPSFSGGCLKPNIRDWKVDFELWFHQFTNHQIKCIP